MAAAAALTREKVGRGRLLGFFLLYDDDDSPTVFLGAAGRVDADRRGGSEACLALAMVAGGSGGRPWDGRGGRDW